MPLDPVPHEGCVLVSVGRLQARKRHDLVLRALARVPEVRLVLVGEGEERTRLERLAERLGIRGRVAFAGWVGDARTELRGADVFVLASDLEGLPLSVLEAMLARLPVVATDVGSVREAVVDGETGIVVPAGDLDAVIAAIGRLAADRALRERLGAAGRVRVRERFVAEKMAAGFERLYRELVPGY